MGRTVHAALAAAHNRLSIAHLLLTDPDPDPLPLEGMAELVMRVELVLTRLVPLPDVLAGLTRATIHSDVLPFDHDVAVHVSAAQQHLASVADGTGRQLRGLAFARRNLTTAATAAAPAAASSQGPKRCPIT